MDFIIKQFGAAFYAFPKSKKAKADCLALKCKSYWSPTLSRLAADLERGKFTFEISKEPIHV